MKREWLKRLTAAAPWAVSLAIHAAVILPLVFVVMISAQKLPEVIYPEAQFSDAPAGQLDGGGGGTNAEGSIKLDAPPAEATGPTVSTPDALPDPTVGDGGGAADLIGIGGGGPAGGQIGALGLSGGGGAPRGSFFGIKPGGNVHHVVYVVDRSGSMFECFDEVRLELLRSLSRLSDQQDFHVIFFADAAPQENPTHKLVSGTRASKLDAAHFLKGVVVANRSGSGMTDPTSALRRAFEVLRGADGHKPGNLVYLLTDGEFSQDVVKVVAGLNADKRTAVNTILFNNNNPVAERILRQIAEQNGGVFRRVSPD